MISEKEVLKLFESNKEIALKFLHNQYADLCYSVSLRYLNNREDAEEIVLNTFMTAYNKLENFTWSFEGSLKAWLKKVTVNECLMSLRKKKLSFDDRIEDIENNLSEPPLNELEYEDIIRVLNTLPLQYKTVFQLYEIDGYTHSEIALILTMSVGTSKSYLNRAKNILKDRLQILGYNE